jgi:hypothetical protein
VEQCRAVGQRRRDGPLEIRSKNSLGLDIRTRRRLSSWIRRDARTLKALVETGRKKNTGEKATAGGDR